LGNPPKIFALLRGEDLKKIYQTTITELIFIFYLLPSNVTSTGYIVTPRGYILLENPAD